MKWLVYIIFYCAAYLQQKYIGISFSIPASGFLNLKQSVLKFSPAKDGALIAFYSPQILISNFLQKTYYPLLNNKAIIHML